MSTATMGPATMQPVLRSERLILRPFRTGDVGDVAKLAGDREVARGTLTIPHPYDEGDARRWIESQAEAFARGELANFAIILAASDELIGAIGLRIDTSHSRAELGYWIGVPYWGCGYCTEAAKAVLDFGFRQLRLNRIHAHHFVDNPASGTVLRRAGLRYEGRLRQHVRRWGDLKDLDMYGLLQAEWLEITGVSSPVLESVEYVMIPDAR